jgi:hypothetical protein
MYNTKYNTKYQCRYNNDDIFLDSDKVSIDEKNYIRDILYKEDLTNIFEIDSSDRFNIFNDIIPTLYERIKCNNDLKECMKKIAATIISDDEVLGLCLLYAYDFMYLTHKCVSEYLDSGIITDENITLLKKNINNYIIN